MKILKKIAIALVLLVAVGFVLKDPLWSAIKPHFGKYMRTFPESAHRNAEVEGSYASIACHNSHSNWGETVRYTQSLDGSWDLEQGALNDDAPGSFSRTVPVPGFITEATPKFSMVGLKSDERDAFWYRKQFTAPASASAKAVLCLSKAKYGVKVWLNGQALGEHYGAFSLSEYDLSSVIRFGESNELIVRLGSEYTKVPEFIPIGTDGEKDAWYPGLWDSVSVVYSGDCSIVRTKVEPNIDRSVAVVHTTVRNNSEQPVDLTVNQQIKEWKSQQSVSENTAKSVRIPAGETTIVTQDVVLPQQVLWTPENPFLYVAHTTVEQAGVASDDRATRFGMRKFEWKAGEDKGFYLNNKPYYLRGTNIAMHRFFGDPERKQLPWNETWVRQLLSGHMKDFHWNSFRFHIGRAPNLWYDLADEVGLIVNDEYFIFAPLWTNLQGSDRPMSNNWSLKEMEKEYTAWIQENWNHASIGWWSASNENHNPLPYEVVPLVRHLDPTRAWESGSYRAPHLPNDPIEEHPYKLNGATFQNSNDGDYTLDDLDRFSRMPPESTGIVFRTYDGEGARNHPYINNEYGWMWLTRDGSDAASISKPAYDLLAPGIDLKPEERREIYAYVMSELSGYWRARRGYAGVQHFVYLSKCTDKDTIPADAEVQRPSSTCDNFIDIPDLVMEPRWAQWAPHGFAPVAANLEKWAEDVYQPGENVSVPVSLVNDTYEDRRVNVKLLVADKEGQVLVTTGVKPVTLAALATDTVIIDVQLPEQEQFVIYAYMDGEVVGQPVISRRKRGFSHPGVHTILPAELGSMQ
jgi:beta-galactosidase